MNAHRFSIAPLACIGTAAAAAVSLFIVTDAFAAPRCESPRDRVDRVACEKAQESPQALRRFISRTESIYHLYFYDYMSPGEMDRSRAQAQLQPWARGEERLQSQADTRD